MGWRTIQRWRICHNATLPLCHIKEVNKADGLQKEINKKKVLLI